MKQKYNFIYEKLVRSENDLVGLVAYGIYKKHKIEFITKIKEESAREPDDVECNAFFISSTTDSQLNKYRNDAESLLSEMVMTASGKEIEEYEIEMLKDYQKAIRKALPSNTESVLLSVLAAFLFSVIASLFFFLGGTSEKATNEKVNEAIERISPSANSTTNDSVYSTRE